MQTLEYFLTPSQSYALLRYENFVRFQNNHENDFDEVDAQEYARQLWTEWLEDERNIDFKEVYDNVGEIGQQELLEHVISPFIDIDDVTETENGTWSFEDENISAFTYLAVLGTGVAVPLVCLIMQVCIPLLLLYKSLGERTEEISGSLLNDIMSSMGSCEPVGVAHSWEPKDDDEGGAFNSVHGKVMTFLVALYYLFQVVPNTMVSFYNTAGTADTSYSKIMSMRRMVWDQGDDYVGQMFGYKIDLYFNTVR